MEQVKESWGFRQAQVFKCIHTGADDLHLRHSEVTKSNFIKVFKLNGDV